MTSAFGRVSLALLFLAVASAAPARQAPPAGDVGEAQRLSASGNYRQAVELLRARLAANPDDGEAARLLAQNLYWMGDVPGARRAYDDALARHPEDTTLVLQYARMLAETGQRDRARQMVLPLASAPPTQARAHALLGMIAYWDGDLVSARQLLARAVAEDPGQQEARQELQAIVDDTSPWVRVSSGYRRDDQPISRGTAGVDARWYLTPLAPVTVHLEPSGYWMTGAGSRTVALADVTVSDYVPAAKLEGELSGGLVYRSSSSSATDWLGHAMAGLRITPDLTARARIERAPYFYTVASLVTPVMTDTVAGVLDLKNPRGWLGEAAYQRQRFPDGNVVTSAYGWLLAPIYHRGGNDVQVGYAVGYETADASRFVLANPSQPYPPSDPRFSTAGVYDPYYTPNHLLSHSAIGALTVHVSKTTVFRLGGSYAVHATEDEPVFVVSGGQAQLMFVSHTLTPWNGRASLEFALGPSTTVALSTDFGRTSFYAWGSAGIQVTRRFGSRGGAAGETPR